MSLSTLLRWFTRNQNRLPTASASDPAQSGRAAVTHPLKVPGGEVHPVEDPELALSYCSGLFDARRYQKGRSSTAERAWIHHYRELLATNPDAFSAEVPRLPRVVPRLMSALREPDSTSTRKIVSLIETDPVLAGNVLKVVNSPAMRLHRRQIVSLEYAVTLMGNQRLREIIFAALISPLATFDKDARVNEESLKQIWPETLQTAMNVKIGARHLGGGTEGFALYLAALTHSSGLIVLLRGLETLKATTVSSGFVGQLEALARTASVAIARSWEFDHSSVQLLQDWADADRSTLETALLADAIAFTRLNSLCQRGDLESTSLLAFRETLPRYAQEWTDLPSSSPSPSD